MFCTCDSRTLHASVDGEARESSLDTYHGAHCVELQEDESPAETEDRKPECNCSVRPLALGSLYFRVKEQLANPFRVVAHKHVGMIEVIANVSLDSLHTVISFREFLGFGIVAVKELVRGRPAFFLPFHSLERQFGQMTGGLVARVSQTCLHCSQAHCWACVVMVLIIGCRPHKASADGPRKYALKSHR